MSGSTVVVGRRGLFIFCSVPEISWLNPPLQGYVYTTHASGHDIILNGSCFQPLFVK
jgi:hypothetical protein